jgi:hypothetical protein
MSQQSETVAQVFAANLGVSVDRFKNPLRNPSNLEAIQAVEHNDLWGTESKIFSYCLQEVRRQAGPYQIFGSREVNNVGSCVHRFVDAVHKTNRTVYDA